MQVLGEKLVLAANGRGGLATVALRPSGIFGEGDPLLVPLTVAKAKEGKMKFIIGSGENLMDFTYVGNVAQAHLQVVLSFSWHTRSASELGHSSKPSRHSSCAVLAIIFCLRL